MKHYSDKNTAIEDQLELYEKMLGIKLHIEGEQILVECFKPSIKGILQLAIEDDCFLNSFDFISFFRGAFLIWISSILRQTPQHAAPFDPRIFHFFVRNPNQLNVCI